MSYRKRYVEHVAIWVRDIDWHIRFFHDVLGMTMREIDGPVDNPSQYWTFGGVQFIARPDFAGPEGRLAHLGVMCEDLEAALGRCAGIRRRGDAAGPQLAAPARWPRRRIHPGERRRRAPRSRSTA